MQEYGLMTDVQQACIISVPQEYAAIDIIRYTGSTRVPGMISGALGFSHIVKRPGYHVTDRCIHWGPNVHVSEKVSAARKIVRFSAN